MAVSKAFIIYVWDNEVEKVAAVFRAVGPGEGSRGALRFRSTSLERFGLCRSLIESLNARLARARPSLVFDIAKIGLFADHLRTFYPPPHYAIRDWLASSLEDFFYIRYGWTSEELAQHAPGLADPFKSPERSADPIALCEYSHWKPSGVERVTWPTEGKPGFPVNLRGAPSSFYISTGL